MTEKKFEVGQVWLTRDNYTVEIKEIRNHPNYPIIASFEGSFITYTSKGKYYEDEDDSFDLIKIAPDKIQTTESIESSQSKPTSLTVQEGGDHYKTLKIQPVEYIVANNLSFLQGNVVKYITRYKQKNGEEDIKKVIHYCQLILELEYGNSLTSQESTGKITNPANQGEEYAKAK